MTIPQTQTIEEIAAQAFAGKVLIVQYGAKGIHILSARGDELVAQTATSVFLNSNPDRSNTVAADLPYIKKQVPYALVLGKFPTYSLAVLYLRRRIRTTGDMTCDEGLKEMGLL